MKHLLYILAFVLLFNWVSAQSSPADQPATLEDITKYLQITHSDALFKQVNILMIKAAQESIHQMYLQHKGQLPPDFEAKLNPIISDMFENMPWNEVVQSTIPVYKRHFTHNDMKALIAFYSSPTGKKLSRDQAVLIAESMQYTMPILENYLEKIKQKIQVKTANMIEQLNSTTTTPDPEFLKSNDDIKCVSQNKTTGEFIFTACKL